VNRRKLLCRKYGAYAVVSTPRVKRVQQFALPRENRIVGKIVSHYQNQKKFISVKCFHQLENLMLSVYDVL
jgi:hypothetical protein